MKRRMKITTDSVFVVIVNLWTHIAYRRNGAKKVKYRLVYTPTKMEFKSKVVIRLKYDSVVQAYRGELFKAAAPPFLETIQLRA